MQEKKKTMAELVCLKRSEGLLVQLAGITTRLKRMADMKIQIAIAEFHNCLNFFLIPAAMELERRGLMI